MVAEPTVRTSISSSATRKSADVWEVTCPLPINPIGKGNHFLPAQLTLGSNRRRRISVEVHKVPSIFESVTAADVSPLKDTEVCYVRILEHERQGLEPVAKNVAKKFKGGGKKATKGTVNFITGTLRNKPEDSDDESTGSIDSFMESFKEYPSITGGTELEVFEGWQPRYKLYLRMFHVVERKKRTIRAKFVYKGRSAHREFVFEDEASASDFCNIIEKQKKLLESRLQSRMDFKLGGIKLKKDEKLTLLFDICSGSNIPQGDIGKDSDPYVTVRFDGKKIHKTDFIPTSDNPIWTLQKGSLFIWEVDAEELFQSDEGLIFEVKDYDAFGSNESLGAFNINPRTLYKWNGERREFALKPLLGEIDYKQGKIALRVRRAMEHDINFMEKFHEKRKSKLISLPDIKVGNTIKSIMTVHSKKEKEGPDKGKTKYLIRPGPDPKRKDETAWLKKEKIEEEKMMPSYNWTDIGSGSLGKIFVEILGCDGLPNMDTSSTLGDTSDSFVSLVYEDCFVRTDTIMDCLSPRWLPWTQRAFIFNMMHTSSQLFLAVFDRDENTLNSHDLIGRVSVDISNFQPNITYLLNYKLYTTAKAPREGDLGTIKIRLRLELEDERTLLLSNFVWPENVYVNVDNKKDFEVIKKTVEGDVDMKKFSMMTVLKYYDELWSYLTVFYVFVDAFTTLIFWRGNSIVRLPYPSYSSRSVEWVEITSFPLHSLVAFICTTTIVERPNLLPSFCFFCIGWALLCTEENRTDNPNPWMMCKSFHHFVSALIMGRGNMKHQVIDPDNDVDDNISPWDKRMIEAEKRAKKRAQEYAEQQEQHFKEMEEIGEMNEDLTAIQNSRGFSGFVQSVDPTRVYMIQIQQYLELICTWLRVSTNIVVWEECYFSFLITFMSFILSVVAIFLPWGFLLRWTCRIIVWVAFGPWMKLADIYYFNREETAEEKKENTNRRQQWLNEKKLEAQTKREKAAKLRDFKEYMFGEHICRVNILKKDRYYDLPLPTSSANAYYPKAKSLGELAMQEAGYRRTRVNGQQLVGEMIPQIIETPSTEAPTGKPTKTTDLLEKGSPALFYDSNDSYSAAAIKVGSIVVGAGAITWFGVPLFVYAIRLVLPE